MQNPLLAITSLLFYDILFLAVVLLLIALLSRQKKAAYAVLNRNFSGYFSNPTGYVFLCLFVLLTSMAAFWPHEFFHSNMATLGQLNKWFPFIMLFFIPAITMSIWAEERRQGTDELLLTLPADDFDIVAGKFLAAASIYTASLLFSQLSTFIVLVFLTLGEVDTGLFFANYVGYWCIGLSMIAIGMTASFLTSNLTVGFILGALFNAPLAFASMADVIAPNRTATQFLRNFSISERFDDFGRGVLSSSAFVYFALIAIFGLYLCMIMIGRRHWSGGKDGNSKFLHYFVRLVLLVCIVGLGSTFFRNNDRVRADITDGRVSSISSTTRQMIRSLKPEQPIVVDAYISAEVPEIYAKPKYELISMLKEFESEAKAAKIPLEVHIYDNLETISDQAKLAEDRYGITPNQIRVRERGTMADQRILMGVAFRSGLEKVVIPFLGSGVPVEYELIRSLNTVSRPSRKKLGILKTDAQMNGGFSSTNFQPIPKQAIINELAKQYEIVEVDPTSAIAKNQCDVLLAVQPSSLAPEQMVNFIDAVRSGMPTAIFEDPEPITMSVPGTGAPKQSQQAMMFGGGGNQPKGDITPLWKLLGINIPALPNPMAGGIPNPDLCWQRYNPYPILENLEQATDLWIFARDDSSSETPSFSKDSEITNELRELLFLYCGVVKHDPDAPKSLEIIDLVTTRKISGTIAHDKLEEAFRARDNSAERIRMLQGPPTGNESIAVLVKGKASEAAKEKPEEGAKADSPVHAVYVTDVDCLSSVFVDIRNQPEQYEDFNFRLQNVTFILNVIDVLAGDLEYPKVRRHEPQHSTLRLVEHKAEEAHMEEARKRREFRAAYDEARQKAEAERDKTIQEFRDRVLKMQKDGGVIDSGKQSELMALQEQARIKAGQLERKLSVELEKTWPRTG